MMASTPRRPRLLPTESLVLYISMFVMGGCGLAYEYTLSKLSSDLLGNSVEQWAIIIGVMLFFMGVGSDVQKHLDDEGLLSKFILAEVALGLCGAFGPIITLDAYGRFPSHFVLVQYFFIGSIGLLIGFEIPLLARINAKYSKEIKFNIGGILKMDYVGSLFGALAWVFILPKFFSTTEMAFVLGMVTLVTAGVALCYFLNHIEHWKLLSAVTAISLALVIGGFRIAEPWTSYAEQALYRDRIVHSETSTYQHVVLTESKSGATSMFINGHLQFNSQDEFIYHENLVHPAMLVAKKNSQVLILGGGDGLAAREVLKHPNVTNVTLCDIDPMVTELARTHPRMLALNHNSLNDSRLFVLENSALLPSKTRDLRIPDQKSLSPRALEKIGSVRIVNIDAIKFLEQISARYDVVILDFPDPNAPELAKLYSQSFYRLLRTRLQPGGIIVQQATSPFYAKEAYLNIGRTMASAGFAVLPYHDTVPSLGDWGWWLAGDVRWHSKASLSAQVSSITLQGISVRYLTEETVRASLVFGANQLVSRYQDINTLTTSTVYKRYVEGWQEYF